MIVTVEQLEKLRACLRAVIAFRAAVGGQTADIEWNTAAQGLMLGDPTWRKWWGWAVANRIIPVWSMHEKDLCGADLRDANLNGADLRGTKLNNADLRGVDLRWANLYWADLCGANLEKADLCEADLSGADLRGANLEGANLIGADLRGANLEGANLIGADSNEFTVWPVGVKGGNLQVWILDYSHDNIRWFGYGTDGYNPNHHQFNTSREAEDQGEELVQSGVFKFFRVSPLDSTGDDCACATCMAARHGRG